MKAPLLLATVLLSAGAAIAGPEAPGVELPPRQGVVGALFSVQRSPSDQPILVVESVLTLSPAFRKLHDGDVILSVNGVAVRDPVAAQRTFRSARPGEELRLQIQHGSSAKVVTLTVVEMTEAWVKKYSAAEERMLRDLKVDGRLAYIPQAFCYTGGGGNLLLLTAFVGVVGAAAIESGQPACRETFQACGPMTLLDQDDDETRLKAGGRKYRLVGDWRHLTFDTPGACQAAVSAGNLPARPSGTAGTWSAASQ